MVKKINAESQCGCKKSKKCTLVSVDKYFDLVDQCEKKITYICERFYSCENICAQPMEKQVYTANHGEGLVPSISERRAVIANPAFTS